MSITFHHHRFSNSLNLIAEEVPQAHTAAVGFFVKTGARDEEKKVMGVSHFLEHMMFKGTARRSADDVNREFDEMGADYNAYTSHETTVYYAHVLPEFLSRAVDLVGDILRPQLKETDFTLEKNVILEEISMYEDRPQWRLNDALMESYFRDHTLSFRVLGTKESIQPLHLAQMQKYFEARYGADNITVAAAGRFDFKKLVDDVGKISASWKSMGAHRVYRDAAIGPAERAIADDRLNRHYMSLMCPGPGAQDERRYAASVLADVLGAAEGSRLHWALIDPGLADEAEFSHSPQDRVGGYLAYVSCDPQRAGKVEKILLDTLDKTLGGVEQAEIDRAKNKLATSLTLHGELPLGRMMSLGGHWTYLGEYSPLEAELEKLMNVTLEDVNRLLREMPFDPRVIVRLGPGKHD